MQANDDVSAGGVDPRLVLFLHKLYKNGNHPDEAVPYRAITRDDWKAVIATHPGRDFGGDA